MSKQTEMILIICAILGVVFAGYTAYQAAQGSNSASNAEQLAQQAANNAANPIATIGTEIEHWFAHLWGNSSGGTPESSVTS